MKPTLDQHLTDMLDRLMNEDLTSEQLKLEVTRAKAVAEIATRKIENSKVMLQAVKVVSEADAYMPQVEKIIGIESKK